MVGHVRSGIYLSFVVVAMAAVSVSADQPVKAFTGEARVQIVEIPVRVFDSSTGRPVRGLTAEDFQILENGDVRKISNFAEIDTGSRERAGSEGGSSGLVPGVSEYRQIIYFFDLYLMETRDRDRAIEALRRQYAHGVRPLELVSFAAFDGNFHAILDSSRDRGAILKALDELSGLKAHGISQRLAFTNALTTKVVTGERKLDYYERRQRSREYMIEMERRIQRVGNSVSMALQRFSAMDGQKMIVVLSPGQPETSWAPSYSPVDYINGDVAYPAQDLWKSLALEASDLGFTLYVIDSSGFRSSSDAEASSGLLDNAAQVSRADKGPRRPPEGRSVESGESPQAPQNLGRWLERNRKNMLEDAARMTGGNSVFSTKILEAVEGIEKQWRHWYSLAYSVDHTKPSAVHQIEVRLKGHAGYRLEYRRAYRERSAADRDSDKMRSVMLFGSDANPLGIRVEFGEPVGRFHLGASHAKRVRIPVVVKIPLGRLDFLPQGDSYGAKVVLSFFSRDHAGNQSPLAREEQAITVEKSKFEEAMRGGYFSYKISLELEGGKQSIAIGVQDELSNRRSVVSRDFDF